LRWLRLVSIRRQIGFLREVLNGLRTPVLGEHEIVRGEAFDDLQLLVANRGVNVHDIDVGGELSILLCTERLRRQ